MARKIRVALAGMGFGAEFVPIYLHHPNVESLTICDVDKQVLDSVGDRYEVPRRTTDFNSLVNSDEYDAVHLVTPIPYHAQQTVAVLKSGKHCACTVPMATSLDDLKEIVSTQRKSGKIYMGMETAVYTRRFLYVKEMVKNGEFGRIQFLRGAHYQDMEGWPPYWAGLPPFHYATHAVSPVLAIANTRARAVHCFGSGVMRSELRQQYNNPFPVETMIMELESATPLAAEITRSLFHTAHGYTESFNVYGEKATFEWEQIEDEPPVVFRMAGRMGETQGGTIGTDEAEIAGLSPVLRDRMSRLSVITAERIEVPDRQDLLPKEIARFTQRGVYDENNPHLSFLQGGGHGGSHPHMVHEFVSSIIEERQPWCNAVTTANWTAPGICGHISAMNGGKRVEVPCFD